VKIHTISIFPEIIASALAYSIPGKAQDRNLIELEHLQLRDFARDKHHKTDDIPYGGGVGMVFKPDPVAAAVGSIRSPATRVIHPSPAAPILTQDKLRAWSRCPHLVFVASRYEGLDQRAVDLYVDEEVSLGDYVISGGELAVAVLIDAIVRLLPGAIGKKLSYEQDSFYGRWLDYPHYTRPAIFEGREVPEVLRSGHHEEIARWRRKQALLKTARLRPDLIERDRLNDEERRWLDEAP